VTRKPPSDWPYAHVIAEALQNNSSPAADSIVAGGSPSGETSRANVAAFDELRSELVSRLKEVNGQVDLASIPRRDLVRQISEFVSAILKSADRPLTLSQQRELVSLVLADLMSNCGPASGPANGSKKAELGETAEPPDRLRASHSAQPRNDLVNNKQRIQPLLMERIDTSVILQLSRKDLAAQISEIVSEILAEEKLRLNRKEQQELVAALLDDMLGLGPLEPLLADETVNDILVNGPKQVYVERRGRLERTDVTFRDNAHVMNVATRIASMRASRTAVV
jgi:pilus assembly protein CpaF